MQKRSRALGAVIRAEIALAAKKPVEAIDALTAARALADLWLVRYTLGRAYVEQGRYAEAMAEFEACQKRIGEATDVFLDDWPTFRYYGAAEVLAGPRAGRPRHQGRARRRTTRRIWTCDRRCRETRLRRMRASASPANRAATGCAARSTVVGRRRVRLAAGQPPSP